MRPIPRLVSGLSEDEVRVELGTHVRKLVNKHGYSIEEFCREHGISLQQNVVGRVDFTREKIHALVGALELQPEEETKLWNAYMGDIPSSMAGIVRANVRRFGMEDIAQKAGVGTAMLTYLMHGYSHSDREKKGPHHPPLETWRKIAQALGLEEKHLRDIWSNDMRRFGRDVEGKNELGAEAGMLLREKGIATRDWRKNPPEVLKGKTIRERDEIARSFRNGDLMTWQDWELFTRMLELDEPRIEGVAAAWGAVYLGSQPELVSEKLTDWMKTDTDGWLRALGRTAGQAAREGLDPLPLVQERLTLLSKHRRRLLHLFQSTRSEAVED